MVAPSATCSSTWLLSTIGPVKYVPRGTTTRPPPARETASMAFAKAAVLFVSPSATAPNSAMLHTNSLTCVPPFNRKSQIGNRQSQQDLHVLHVSPAADDDGVDDQEDARRQPLPEDQADEDGLGPQVQARPAEAD